MAKGHCFSKNKSFINIKTFELNIPRKRVIKSLDLKLKKKKKKIFDTHGGMKTRIAIYSHSANQYES